MRLDISGRELHLSNHARQRMLQRMVQVEELQSLIKDCYVQRRGDGTWQLENPSTDVVVVFAPDTNHVITVYRHKPPARPTRNSKGQSGGRRRSRSRHGCPGV